MKNYLASLMFLVVFQSIIGQDIVTTKDNKQLKVKILEQTNRLVKYKMTDYEDGPVLSIKTSRIYKINYKNGVVDLMGYQNPRKNKPFGVNGGFALWVSEEGGMFTSTIDYFIIPQIDLELSIGTDLEEGFYLSGGSRFHLNSNSSDNRLTPFTGLLFGTQYGDGFIQVPVGINYLSRPGLSTSLSISEMLFFSSWRATIIELRIGWKLEFQPFKIKNYDL